VFIAIKMALVFALLGGTLWYLRRHDRSALVSARRAERPVAVLAQTKVGKSSSVALVRIGGEAYAVGVTEQRVTLLVDSPIELPEPTPAAESPTPAEAARTAPPATLGAALRSVLGRRQRVEYLDVELPVQTAVRDRDRTTGTDGSGSIQTAGKPEPVRRR
jgi:flagellar biogenesis protein FliO